MPHRFHSEERSLALEDLTQHSAAAYPASGVVVTPPLRSKQPKKERPLFFMPPSLESQPI